MRAARESGPGRDLVLGQGRTGVGAESQGPKGVDHRLFEFEDDVELRGAGDLQGAAEALAEKERGDRRRGAGIGPGQREGRIEAIAPRAFLPEERNAVGEAILGKSFGAQSSEAGDGDKDVLGLGGIGRRVAGLVESEIEQTLLRREVGQLEGGDPGAGGKLPDEAFAPELADMPS